MARSNAQSTKAKKVAKKASRSGATSMDRILQAIATRHAANDKKPSRKMIMGMATMTNKKSFDTTILNIKKKYNMVDYDTNTIWLTQEGKDHVGPDAIAVPTSNDAMQEQVREKMIKGLKPRQIFDLMTDGGWHSKAELAAAMKLPNNKSFGTYISALSKIVERENGKIRLQDMVFPFGRPSH